MNKKSQSLSLNTIIVAIVVLIVLVVLIMVFTGYFGARFTPEVTSCANAGGTCLDRNDPDLDPDNGAPCGYDAFDQNKAELTASCLIDSKPDPTKICCARGLGTGSSDNSGGGLGGLFSDTNDCPEDDLNYPDCDETNDAGPSGSP